MFHPLAVLFLAACAGGASQAPRGVPAPAIAAAPPAAASATDTLATPAVTTAQPVPAAAPATDIAVLPAPTDSAADDSVLEELRGAAPADAPGEEHA
ncbi:MAG TPA: hypothetical protein VLC11_07695, partial [Gemmatimonadales bacterium]|nr:hypothetical protein [Gemmatimonadales bacterium]